MQKGKMNEEAFTGLEAAIVLIAFVVVAAVFSYVVLGAGFFTTQKSQQVVHSGVTQAASNIVVKGDIYGVANAANTSIVYIRFDVGLAAGGLPVDMNKTTMVFSTPAGGVQTLNKTTTLGSTPSAGQWSISERRPDLGNDLLQSDSLFTIYVQPPAPLNPRDTFNIEIKPEAGAALAIQRSVPAGITNTTLLY